MHTVHKIIKAFYANSKKRYLELGIWNGQNFNDVELDEKDSVDISDALSVPKYLMSTDSFFAENKDKKYDIIFIDADHSAKQVLLDYNNAVSVLEEGGLIFLHDLYPPNEMHTQRNLCDDGYKILDHFLSHSTRVLVELSDYGSTCVFNPMKITEDIDFGLEYAQFVQNCSKHSEVLCRSYSKFEENFARKMFSKQRTV